MVMLKPHIFQMKVKNQWDRRKVGNNILVFWGCILPPLTTKVPIMFLLHGKNTLHLRKVMFHKWKLRRCRAKAKSTQGKCQMSKKGLVLNFFQFSLAVFPIEKYLTESEKMQRADGNWCKLSLIRNCCSSYILENWSYYDTSPKFGNQINTCPWTFKSTSSS